MIIRVFPRKYLEDMKGTDDEESLFNDFNVISIITPAYPRRSFEEEKIPFSESYRNEALVLRFHDTERRWNDDVVLFSEEDAQRIHDFVMSTKDNGKKGYIIHCTAGYSRSQAVGYVLNEYFNGRFGIAPNEALYDEYERLYCNCRKMNSLVKKMLMERFFG